MRWSFQGVRRARRVAQASAASVVLAASVAACGSGSSGDAPPASAVPAPRATALPFVVGGSVVTIPGDAYGPAVIAGITYQSADAATTTPLADATVIVGPVPIVGPTAPAILPSGDVAATTGSGGTFVAMLTVPPAPPAVDEPFVLPQNNITNFVAPGLGYYVQVFGPGSDGASAGRPIPLHRFLAASTSLVLRVSTPSAAEAGALVTVNNDRAANNAGPLTFDESAEEAARLHASDESNQSYYCHYDTKDVGPTSRYLQVGGVGLSGESIALPGSHVTSGTYAFQVADAQFMSEKSQMPPGLHFKNNVDMSKFWAGLAAVSLARDSSVFTGGFYAVDYELVTPNGRSLIGASSGYDVDAFDDCVPGVVDNNS